MSRRARSIRPKIISYPSPLDGLDVAARENLLWPCHAFNISIPVKKKRGLNIFEETILKLTEVESGDTGQLSITSCLDKELVLFIQNRLKQLGYVSERYDLTGQGRELLSGWESDSVDGREYAVATVYVDLLNGKIIPYVNSTTVSYERVEFFDNNTGSVAFSRGTKGKANTISARQIFTTKDSFLSTTPNTRDIVTAIREFKKRYKRYVLLNRDIDRFPPPIPMAEAVSIQDAPELVYIHCIAVVQKGNPEILVTDGFGFGFSEIFANYLRSQDWQWLIDLKSKGIIDNLTNKPQRASLIQVKGFGAAIKTYPKIYRAVRRANDCFSEAQNMNIKSSNDEHELKRLIGTTVTSLYEAIEWTLRKIVFDDPVEHWGHIFSSQSYRDNDLILRSLARKLGFDVSDKNQFILQVKPGKIRAIEHGVAEMQPLLALAIAGAINNNAHPLHRLVGKDSTFFSFVNWLKAVRDPISHGNASDVELTIEKLEQYRDRTARIIKTLIPSLTEALNLEGEIRQQPKDIDQLRLKASRDLDFCFGRIVVQSIRPELKECLLKLIMFEQRIEFDLDYVQQYINSLAAAMQLAFFEIISSRQTSDELDDNLKDRAFKRSVDASFFRNLKEIPASISTVNAKRVSSAVEGMNTTLGAHLIALFVLCSDEELDHFYQKIPTLFSVVDKLLSLRGHGNKQAQNSPKDELISFKNTVFDTIKIIVEV